MQRFDAVRRNENRAAGRCIAMVGGQVYDQLCTADLGIKRSAGMKSVFPVWAKA